MTQSNFIRKFIADFNEAIYSRNRDQNLSLDRESKWIGPGNRTVVFDAVLYVADTPLAIFEFSNYKPSDQINLDREILISSMDLVRYFVIVDTHKYLIIDYSGNDIKLANTIEELIETILIDPSGDQLTTIKKKISEIFYKVAKRRFKNKTTVLDLLKLETIEQNLQYDKGGKFFHLTKDIRDLSNFENRMFNAVIEDVPVGGEIHRYTALETVFATLNYKSMRLNGIVGMNDITETGYVETYVNKDHQPFWSEKTPPSYVNEINRRFISCSSILEDELNQWRLYSEDSRGACLTFRVKEQGIIPGIRLKKISYGRKVNGRNHHEELEFLKTVVEKVKSELKQIFRFRCLHIWKHFFKSYEYMPEKEVRLLIIVSSNNSIKGEAKYGANPHSFIPQWNLTTSHKILNPFITVNLNDEILPIELTKVWLGPNCPEKNINKKQIEEFLRSKELGNVSVLLSNIQSYR